jgi:sulfane dehydrogenase subunit SoxC
LWTRKRTVFAEAKQGRRDFIRRAFASAVAGGAAAGASLSAGAQSNPVPTEGGDPNILELPEHSKAWGKGWPPTVTANRPSSRANVQRRPSPGLTQTTQSSVSFAPLQSLFGIVTPSGLHFERHHQGWWDVDPSKHRLMVNGSDDRLVKTPKVFTMDEIMRLPSVSRFHFIECGANSGMEWGNVAVPTVQYSHGMLSCSEFTGVPLKILLDLCGVDYKRGRYVLAEGADGSSMTRTIPMEMVESGEVFVAYGQNGEMLRPENGYPLRLVVPGVQGVSWVKYLRRIEVGDAALRHQGRGGALHRPAARWPAPPVHQHPGVQERGHHALGRPGAAGQGLLQHQRPGLVGPRQGQEGGRVGGRRPQLAPARLEGR